MSRVGKAPIVLAKGVNVTAEGQKITVKGAKSTLTFEAPVEVAIKVDGTNLLVNPVDDSNRARAMWGLARNTLSNMVKGVSEGFTINLQINGVGYRASAEGKVLKLALGFSHPVEFAIPAGIEIKTPKPTEVIITGADKQLVGQVAANIRGMKKPEPYKGKGIKYAEETIRRKEGKKK